MCVPVARGRGTERILGFTASTEPEGLSPWDQGLNQKPRVQRSPDCTTEVPRNRGSWSAVAGEPCRTAVIWFTLTQPPRGSEL